MLFVVGLAVGTILGTLEIALVAFADEVGARSWSGLLIAALAIGSMVSGIGWGTVHFRAPLRRRLLVVLPVFAVSSLPLLLVDDLWVMLPFVVLAGVAVSPSLISAFTLAEVLVPRAAVTEAFTWIGTALAIGVALGASVAGKVVDVDGRQPGLPGGHGRARRWPGWWSRRSSGCSSSPPSAPTPWPAEPAHRGGGKVHRIGGVGCHGRWRVVAFPA